MSSDESQDEEISLSEAVARITKDFPDISEDTIIQILNNNEFNFEETINELEAIDSNQLKLENDIEYKISQDEIRKRFIQKRFYNGDDYETYISKQKNQHKESDFLINNKNLYNKLPGYEKHNAKYKSNIDYHEINEYGFLNNEDIFNLNLIGCDDPENDELLCEILEISPKKENLSKNGSAKNINPKYPNHNENNQESNLIESQIKRALNKRRQTRKLSELFNNTEF